MAAAVVAAVGLWRGLVMFHFDVPNLDDLEPPELEQVAAVFTLLAEYAKNAACGVRSRLSGQIEAAQASERAADSVYKLLPQWARW